MKRAVILFLIVLLGGCGYGMQFTKSVPLVPSSVLSLKVAEIEDIKTEGQSQGSGL